MSQDLSLSARTAQRLVACSKLHLQQLAGQAIRLPLRYRHVTPLPHEARVVAPTVKSGQATTRIREVDTCDVLEILGVLTCAVLAFAAWVGTDANADGSSYFSPGNFSSKSELALNLSTDGQEVSFMGYLAPVDAIDVSNSNTPGVNDPTNPVPGSYYRVVGQVDSKGKFRFTKTSAYSGNNGRAAILNSADDVLYTAGNAGNVPALSPTGSSSAQAPRSSSPR